MTEPRPHREALPPQRAAEVLGREADAGRLDAASVAAVLDGGRAPGPAGDAAGRTDERETQVVALVARGLQTKQIGRALGISAKTADRHVQNAYAKIGSRRGPPPPCSPCSTDSSAGENSRYPGPAAAPSVPVTEPGASTRFRHSGRSQ